MRVLVLSNFYPPYFIGGYEIGCYEAVEGLRQKGHPVKVLTSSYGVADPMDDGLVYRWLRTYVGRGFNKKDLLVKELYNRHRFKTLVNAFKPDVLYVWNPWQISLSLVYTAHRLGLPVCYYVFDHWLAHWGQADDWFQWWAYAPVNGLKRWTKRRAGRLVARLGLETRPTPPDLCQAQFASNFLKQHALRQGQPVDDARVIHWGIDLNRFPYRQQIDRPASRLLYIGQLVPHKGVHTLIEALKRLVDEHSQDRVTLTIVGGTVLPDYEQQLKDQVQTAGLAGRVRFFGPVPREDISGIYQTHDILIVPSTWDEPFGLILLEAMATGLAVVGTATGGSAEILQHRFNGLVFPREDARACAACISQLLSDPDLLERLRRQGRHSVQQNFSLERAIDQVEQTLQEALVTSL